MTEVKDALRDDGIGQADPARRESDSSVGYQLQAADIRFCLPNFKLKPRAGDAHTPGFGVSRKAGSAKRIPGVEPPARQKKPTA
jgi:hypothetical protein